MVMLLHTYCSKNLLPFAAPIRYATNGHHPPALEKEEAVVSGSNI